MYNCSCNATSTAYINVCSPHSDVPNDMKRRAKLISNAVRQHPLIGGIYSVEINVKGMQFTTALLTYNLQQARGRHDRDTIRVRCTSTVCTKCSCTKCSSQGPWIVIQPKYSLVILEDLLPEANLQWVAAKFC